MVKLAKHTLPHGKVMALQVPQITYHDVDISEFYANSGVDFAIT